MGASAGRLWHDWPIKDSDWGAASMLAAAPQGENMHPNSHTTDSPTQPIADADRSWQPPACLRLSKPAVYTGRWWLSCITVLAALGASAPAVHSQTQAQTQAQADRQTQAPTEVIGSIVQAGQRLLRPALISDTQYEESAGEIYHANNTPGMDWAGISYEKARNHCQQQGWQLVTAAQLRALHDLGIGPADFFQQANWPMGLAPYLTADVSGAPGQQMMQVFYIDQEQWLEQTVHADRVAGVVVCMLPAPAIVQRLQSDAQAVATLAQLRNGQLLSWGQRDFGGQLPALPPSPHMVQLLLNGFGAVALTAAGQAYTWGDLPAAASPVSDLQALYRTDYGGIAAINSQGAVFSWGEPDWGGDSSAVSAQLKDIQDIRATAYAFTALSAQGKVISWGPAQYGGTLPADASDWPAIIDLQASSHAFAALTEQGEVFTWGDGNTGGDSQAQSAKLKQVVRLYANRRAFAALTATGRLITWGDPLAGGDSSAVQDQLQQIVHVAATDRAFAALTASGQVVTWGDPQAGGNAAEVQDQLQQVYYLSGNRAAFVALTAQQGLVSWGDASAGGDSGDIAAQLQQPVRQIVHSGRAFALITTGGQVLAWGDAQAGGQLPLHSPWQHAQPLTDMLSLSANQHSISAWDGQGRFVRWGAPLTAADQALPPLAFDPFPAADSIQDSDGDGLSNRFEINHCQPFAAAIGDRTIPCLDPGNPDSDGDGVGDGFEWQYGSNPLHPAHLLIQAGQLSAQAVPSDHQLDLNQDGLVDGWRRPQALRRTSKAVSGQSHDD